MTESLRNRKRMLLTLVQLQRRQFSIAFESTILLGLTSADRRKVVNQLSQVLLQAAGISAEGNDDER